MVRPRRLELPRELNPTRSLVWRVYQFRHGRTLKYSIGHLVVYPISCALFTDNDRHRQQYLL